MSNTVIMLIANMEAEIFRDILDGMSECLNKDGDYEYLFAFKGNQKPCYFITDKQIFEDCVNNNLAPGLIWGTKEDLKLLSENLLDYEFEGNARLLGWSYKGDDNSK